MAPMTIARMAVFSILTAEAAATLYETLISARFLHDGIVSANDTYTYAPVPCGYLEPENVTVAPAQGIGWTQGGACPHLFACTGMNCTPACNAQSPHTGYDRQGGDYRAFQLPALSPDGAACEAACCADAACNAWVYAPDAPPGQAFCKAGMPCCYLKSIVNAESPDANITNGVMKRLPFAGVSPPMGLRSAVPLGGIGAGALELRADGTFHEVTIMNQSPAGAAKFGVMADMLLGVRIGGVARLLRTTPPSYAASAGVSQLSYSGAYPLSRLSVSDEADFPGPVAIFAYSKLVPGDPSASAAPAVIFTLTVSNPTLSPLNASVMFALPLGAVNDCARVTGRPIATVIVAGYADCLTACSATGGCASWTFYTVTGSCALAPDTPLSVHADGAYCGVQGGWSADGAIVTLNMPCNSTAPSPACGDATLQPVLVGAPGTIGSVGVSNDPAALWKSFASSGTFTPGAGIIAAGSFFNITAAHAAASAMAVVPPGGNMTLSIVFAWYFPHRDHAAEDIGNFYSTLWESSIDVSKSLAVETGGLDDVAADIAAHHAVFAGQDSSLVDWLADHMINQMSHFRGMIWSRDGRMREFEAFDCMDLDSIHNDGQRHLPYLWLMPQFEVEKLRKWATGQLPNGAIQEFLGPFGVGPFDVPGGRIMGDTTTMWVLGLHEIWKHTGDSALLGDLWSTARGALSWLIINAATLGLPYKLYSTYDILWLDTYNTTSYNAFLYMAALKAGEHLADEVGDKATSEAAAAALAIAGDALQALLYNTTHGYYRAYAWGADNAVMADSLYGQIIARYQGLGWLAPPAQLSAHLQVEESRNYDLYGLRVMTGRISPPPGGQKPDDDTVWGQGGPDWSALALMLGTAGPTNGNVAAALEPARRSLDNWRSRLHDLWNLAGLTSTDNAGDENIAGMPWVTSHYGFLLVDYYLLPALSGQQTDIPGGTLSFAPVYSCPFRLPALLAGTTGTISCDVNGIYTLAIAFGSLTLPAGGLSVNGKAYNGVVTVAEGDYVSW